MTDALPYPIPATDMDGWPTDDYNANERQPFTVTDLSSLAWVGRRIRDAKSRIAEIQATANAERKRIVEWEDKATRKDRSDIAFFEAKAVDFLARRQFDGDPAKSVSAPGIIVKSRALPPEVTVTDEAMAMTWARAAGWVRTKTELDMRGIRQLLTDADRTGDVPGIALVKRPAKYSVEVDE